MVIEDEKVAKKIMDDILKSARLLRNSLTVKEKPNVYDWEKLKETVGKYIEFEFDQKLEIDDNKDSFEVPFSRLPYTVKEENDKRILQFAISEPNNEDVGNGYISEGTTSDYIEVLKVTFFEFFYYVKNQMFGEEANKYDTDKEWNRCFAAELLVPGMELSLMYHDEKVAKDVENSHNEKAVNIEKMTNHFHVNYEIINLRLSMARESHCW